MPGGFGGEAKPWVERRRGELILPGLPELEPTPVQRCLREWVAAGERSAVFRELMITGLQVERRVTEVLERSGPVGEDHGALLRLMSLSMVSQLLTPEAMAEAHDTCPMQDWLDAKPSRVAWSVAVGGGKTLTAASVCRAVADLMEADPDGAMARGVLYSCRTHKLLQGMLNALELMGVPRELVGVFHGTAGAAVPSIKREVVDRFPILLTTQQQIQKGSAEYAEGDHENGLLEQLLVHRGRDRLVIWDEAFRSSLADVAHTEQLALAVGALRGLLGKNGGGGLELVARDSDRDREPSDVLPHEDGMELAGLLDGIASRAIDAFQSGGSGATIQLPGMSELQVKRLENLAALMQDLRNDGLADAVGAVAQMAVAGQLEATMLDDRGPGRCIVRPRVKVSDRIQRVQVLDAGYMTSLLSQMDSTLRLASGANYAGRELQPKLFGQVRVKFFAGPSGRGISSKSSGLCSAAARQKLIRQQVERISRVPLGELSLVVTFKKVGSGPDFISEIEAELDKKVPGWKDQINGRQRVTVIQWGEHVGSNEWRDAKHLFFVGVLRRTWVGDMANEAYAVNRDGIAALAKVKATEIETNQACQEIMQAIGRGHARKTINGHAGQMTIHLPWKESNGRWAGKTPAEGSPLWDELKMMMPGCQLESEGTPIKASNADLVVKAAELALAEVEGDEISTVKLKPLVLKHLPDGGRAVSDRVFVYGLNALATRNAERAAAGEQCWHKPTPEARRWVRSAAA